MEQRAGRLPFWIETQCISWWRPIRWLGFSGLRILIDHINQTVIQPYTKANRANDLGSYRGQSILVDTKTAALVGEIESARASNY